MRPRHKAAENRRVRNRYHHTELVASMRPRHKAAENPASEASSRSETSTLQ